MGIRSILFCLLALSLGASTPATAKMLIAVGDVWFEVGDDFPSFSQEGVIKILRDHAPSDRSMLVKLTGEIKPVWLTGFDNALKFARREKFNLDTLIVNSTGGDVRTAIALGRRLFDNGMGVTTGECLSACVLILAGGKFRFVIGKSVGVHRPFETSVNKLSKSGKELQEKYDQIKLQIGTFLTEMAVSNQLLDLMMSTPSTKMRILSQQELDDFGLGFNNVAYEELRREYRVRKCGSDYDERYLQAEREIDEVCKGLSTLEEVGRCVEITRKKYRIKWECG